jgi:hypothetical protein
MSQCKWVVLLWLAGSAPAFAQKITNVRAKADSSLVTIFYDLEGTAEGQLYRVGLYGSHNNYKTPLIFISGDAGPSLAPGTNRKIQWQAKELTSYEGEIVFEVRAILVFSPLKLNTFPVNFRRGKIYAINWQGGLPTEKVKLELYRDSLKVSDIVSFPNGGKYDWFIPTDTKPGKNYRLRVQSEEKTDNFYVGTPFAIHRKIPLGLKIIPLALIAGGAGYLIAAPKPEKTDNTLPDPALPK